MRLVIERVNKASVSVVHTNKVVGEIGKGLFVLVGIKKGDSIKEAAILASKLVKLRVMADPPSHKASEGQRKMNFIASSFLVVSQFTLYADTSGGNRPSFIDAEEPSKALKIYEHFVVKLKELGVKVETGSFGDYMKITTELDGPVTIVLES